LNHKPIDKAMLILVAGLILVLALLNIFQAERPTVSETENRVLATWPEWNTADVASGKYFADIMAFFSDTFYGREELVKLSKKMDQLKGYFDDCDLWISCRRWPAWVEWPQGGWTIWQYSDVGEVKGAANAEGHVDLDVLAKGLSVDDLLM